MSADSSMSVDEAADVLGLAPRAVRLLAASGDLAAVKRGRSWWIDRRAVEQRSRQQPSRGRPLSAPMAWSVLLLASGVADAQELVRHAHSASRARNWLAHHPLPESAVRLRSRARSESFAAHPSEVRRIIDHQDVMRTGISAADLVGIHGGAEVAEAYAPAGRRERLMAEHALEPGNGPVLLRWVDDDVWPAVAGEVAPRAAVLVDLLEHDDPRARRKAGRMLAG